MYESSVIYELYKSHLVSEQNDHSTKFLIIKMQSISNLTGWNSVHISDISDYCSANINEMWNARKLGEIYKTLEIILT